MDNSLKDKVLEAIDIVDVIGERIALKRRGKEFLGLCPFHADHRPSLSVSPQKQIFKCWSCGAGGDVIRFVELYDRVGFRDALAALARGAGIDQRVTAADRGADRLRGELRAALAWARDRFRANLHNTPAGVRAREYAAERGLSPATIDAFNLGLAVDDWQDMHHAAGQAGLRDEILQQAGLLTTNEQGRTYDRFRNRLVFPIADALGRPVGFGGRTLGDDPAKYLNSPETVLFSKSRILYGFDVARQAIDQQRSAIVVEGYLDAVLLHQHGFRNAVATLGTSLSEAHAKLLRARADTLYLCFDGDRAGADAASRAVEVALQSQTAVRVVLLDAGTDPADCVQAGGCEAFAEKLKGARDALEFKWSQTLKAFGEGGPQARRAAVEAFLKFVAGAAAGGGVDPLQQNLLVGRLGDLLGVPGEAVFELLTRARRPVVRRGAGEPAGVDGASAYDRSIRGLPGGLISAVETVFGLLVIDASCWRGVDDNVVRAARYSQTWEQLYRVLLEVHEDLGEYSLGEVVARCDDSAVCELVGRAQERVAGLSGADEHFAAARDQLVSELDVLRVRDRREELRQSGGEDAEAFRSLQAVLRRQHSPLPVERRWNASSAPM